MWQASSRGPRGLFFKVSYDFLFWKVLDGTGRRWKRWEILHLMEITHIYRKFNTFAVGENILNTGFADVAKH